MDAVIVHLSHLLWQKSWQVDVFGQRFDLGLRLVDDGGIVHVELEAEGHRSRFKLAEFSAAVMTVREMIELRLAISDLDLRGGNLKRAHLEVKAGISALGSRTLVRESLAFEAVDGRLISLACDVREVRR